MLSGNFQNKNLPEGSSPVGLASFLKPEGTLTKSRGKQNSVSQRINALL